MSIKKEFQDNLSKIMEKKLSQNILIEQLKKEFKYYLQTAKQAGISLKYTTFILLETVEKLLIQKSIPEKEYIIQKSMQDILDIIFHMVKNDIYTYINQHKNSALSFEKLIEAEEDLHGVIGALNEYVFEKKDTIAYKEDV